MRRAEKVARRNRRNKGPTRKKTKALMVAGTFATAGTTLVAMAAPAWADYGPGNYIYHPGLTLQAGGTVTVTQVDFADANVLVIGSATLLNGSGIALYSPVSNYPAVASGIVPLFAGPNVNDPSVTDCAGESITAGTATFGGCFLKTISGSGTILDQVPVTVAFPIVTQSATKNNGLSDGAMVTVKTNAQGDPTYAATDSVVVEECGPMPVGVGFDTNQCTGLGTMTETSGNYMATVPVQATVGSTTCAEHTGWTGQCSLWTVEVHNDASGKFWWPLANGIPISFK